MSVENNYDDMLYSILVSEGRLDKFFDRIFEFLHRRTDFYTKDDNSRLGVCKDEAENIVKQAFFHYADKEQTVNTTELELQEHHIGSYIEIETEAQKLEEIVLDYCEEIRCVEQSNTETKDVVNGITKLSSVDSQWFNGAKFDTYSWSQSIKDLDIFIKVPNSIRLGKHVQVLLTPSEFSAKVYSEDTWMLLKSGSFTKKINVEESTWILEPGDCIHISVQKRHDSWWNALLVDEPKINLNNIDNSIPYEDLDEESRLKIQELMFDEMQKSLGKPTAQQMKIGAVLKEAWDVEGSPFKGQPYDPSHITVVDDELI